MIGDFKYYETWIGAVILFIVLFLVAGIRHLLGFN